MQALVFVYRRAAVRDLSPAGERQPAGGMRTNMNCIAVHIDASALFWHGQCLCIFRLAMDTLLSVGSLLILAELQSVHEKKRNLRKKKRDFRKKKRNLQKKKRDLRRHFLSALRQDGRPAGEPRRYL